MNGRDRKPLRFLYLCTQVFMLGVGVALFCFYLGFLPEISGFLPAAYVILFPCFCLVLPAVQFFGAPRWAMEATGRLRQAAIFLWIANLFVLWLCFAASLTFSNRMNTRSSSTHVAVQSDFIGTRS